MVDGVDTATRGRLIPLTEREREVANLVAQGLTNADISERLGITFATAKWHVSQVLSKLGIERREEVAGQLERLHNERHHAKRWPRWGVLPLAKVFGIAAAAVPVGVLAVGGILVMVSRGDSVTDHPIALAVSAAVPTEAKAFPVDQPSLKAHTCDWRSAQLNFNGGASDHSGCDFTGVDFGSANLNGAHMERTALVEAVFRGATLGGANLTGSNAKNAKFLDAILQGTNFDGADLTGAQFTNSIVLGATFRGATCPDGLPAVPRGDTCIGTPGLKNLPTTRSIEAAKRLEGKPAPEFSAVSGSGNSDTIDLATLRGRPVVFWWFTSSCLPCSAQAAEMRAAIEKYTSVEFVAVALGETRSTAEEFLAREQLQVMWVLDSDSEMTAAYGVVGLPTTVVIDANGIYKASRVGFYNPGTLEDLLLRSGITN